VTLWTCQRQTDGVVCKHVNPSRKRNCEACGKPRPKRKRPAHRAALDQPYEVFVAINGGDWCGICGVEPTPMKRLDRDHSHVSGLARGLLCHSCNRSLGQRMERAAHAMGLVEWLRAAADYVERAERRAAA